MHLCSWRLTPCGFAWSMQVCVSASWRSADQREPVDRALGAFGRLQHVQVVPRDPRAKRDADRPIAARVRERHGAVGDMKRLAAVALHPDVIDMRVIAERDLGDGIGEIGLRLQRDVVLDDRHRAARLGDHQATRVACSALLRRDEQQMHWRGSRHVARHDDQCAVVQKRGIERGEHVVAEFHVTAEVRLDRRCVRGPCGRQVRNHDAAVPGNAGEFAARRRRRRTRAGSPLPRYESARRPPPSAPTGMRTGWKDSLVSGERSVKRHSSSRIVGTVSTPTRSTASARSSLSHANGLAGNRGCPASRLSR